MKQDSEELRKQHQWYLVKFGFRILILAAVIGIVIFCPGELDVLEGMKFFQHVSVLHILWGLWVWYILEKLLPLRRHKAPRGSIKYRRSEFRPTGEYENWMADKKNMEHASRQTGRQMNRKEVSQTEEYERVFRKARRQSAKGAWKVLGVWILFAVVVFLLKRYTLLGSIENGVLLILSALFYVGDMICILFWCPFRDLFMKNRCCTQCRIYNWDTMMLILPVAFIPGFYSYSLLAGAIVVVGIWEFIHLLHPERFYPLTNANLQCKNCRGELGCANFRKKASQMKKS